MKFVTGLASATLLALLGSHSAIAVDLGDEPRSIVVQFADLNLDSPEGAARLLWRIRSAAERVCANPAKSLEKKMQEKACIKFAVANAVATVDRPTLSRYVMVRPSTADATVRDHR